MVRRSVVVLLAICCGCSVLRKSDPLTGVYVGWMFIDGRAYNVGEKLTLKPDGTYTLQIESSMMAIVSAKAEGTYKRSGSEVILDGTMTSTADDGYRKSTSKGPHKMSLTLENGMLMMLDGKKDPFYFCKEDAGPPPLPPQLQLKESDPAATALLTRIKKTYAGLQTFKVTGGVQSQGGGFVAKDARFKVLFQSPSKLRFEASILDSGKEIDRTEITWDGGPTCWWYSKEDGENTERTLGNALGIAGVDYGPEADILPSLLLPKVIEYEGLLDSPEVTLLPDDTVSGKKCSVLQLRSKGADATKLWIDKSSGMILRLYEDGREVTVTFDPYPNVAIDPKELMLGHRSKPGLSGS